MKIEVDKHYLKILELDAVNRKQANIGDIQFIFNEEIDNSFVKEAYFTKDAQTYKIIIENNKCNYPSEILNKTGMVQLGVVAYKIDDNENIVRYSPHPVTFAIIEGSLRDAENSEPITPSEIEQFEQELQNGLEEVNRLDIYANKVDKTTTITITRKDGTEEQTEILDGLDGINGKDGKDGVDGKDYVITPADYENIATIVESEIDIPDVSNFITKDVNNLTYYTLKTNTGSSISIDINSSTYVMTVTLKNINGNTISTGSVDLPLESVVVSGTYDETTKKIILTLQNGNTIEFSVADLVSGLQTEITSSNKLNSDLVDDTNNTNKFVTTSEKTIWNSKYEKANTGIPKTDLASDVQTSLGKADTAIQQHQDISGKENTSNKITTITNLATNTQYPSALAVYNYVQNIVGYIEEIVDEINGE